MLNLYQAGGGSSEVTLEDPLPPALSELVLARAHEYLLRRGSAGAAVLLSGAPFRLMNATNGFGDDFRVLYAEVPMDRYAALYAAKGDRDGVDLYDEIADAMARVDHWVRFIAIDESNGAGPSAVPAPMPVATSVTLDRALAEVQRALVAGRPEVGVDRVHTAFHAYLREKAEKAGLTPAADAGVTTLFALLRDSHPRLQAAGPRPAETTGILRGMARVVDALDPLRNKASLAHPPEEDLLPAAEAMLVINSVHTLMHYLESRLARRTP